MQKVQRSGQKCVLCAHMSCFNQHVSMMIINVRFENCVISLVKCEFGVNTSFVLFSINMSQMLN